MTLFPFWNMQVHQLILPANRIRLLLLAVLSGPWMVTGAVQIEGFGCIVQGANLSLARANYTAQCTEPRADCDPRNGRWYCASVNMNQSTPPHVFNLNQNTVLQTNEQPEVDLIEVEVEATQVTQPSTPPIQPEIDNSAAAPINDNHPTQSQSAQTTPADITDLVLVTGQSNALGADTNYDKDLDRPHERVFAFTDQGWQVASLHQVWDLGWFPRTHPGSEPSNNFALHFGRQLANSRADRTVGFILATAPGQAIEHWRYQGEFYRSVESKVIDAINQLPHKSKIDGVLWHQGETDANDTQVYTDALYTLIYYLRTEPWADSATPFICGETKQLTVNNRLNGLNRDSDPFTACVRGTDLSTQADGHHFDANGLRTIGSRYADAYRDMLTR